TARSSGLGFTLLWLISGQREDERQKLARAGTSPDSATLTIARRSDYCWRDDDSISLARGMAAVLASAGYTVRFLMVVLGRQRLFTGSRSLIFVRSTVA